MMYLSVFIVLILPIIVLILMITFFVLVGITLYTSDSSVSYVSLPNAVSSVKEESS